VRLAAVSVPPGHFRSVAHLTGLTTGRERAVAGPSCVGTESELYTAERHWHLPVRRRGRGVLGRLESRARPC
jgi:hypothetical protein